MRHRNGDRFNIQALPSVATNTMSPLFDRTRELGSLDRVLADVRRRGQLFLISGRRGAGKTTLVQSWLSARRKQALFWVASENSSEPEQAAQFAHAMGRHLRVTPASARSSASEIWRGAFAQLAEAARTRRQIVVIDQLTDLLIEHSVFASALQQAWDQGLQDLPVLVILIDEHGRRSYEHLHSYERAPLYGRFTAIWQAEPISWLDFSAAFGRWPLRDRLLAYAVTGGWPAFVKEIGLEQTPRTTLTRLVGSPDYRRSVHALVDTVGPTRRSVVRAVLRALASGPASQERLAHRTRLSRRTINAALVDLEIAGLVQNRDVPIEAPLPWTQRVVYRLVDDQVRFYFGAAEAGSNRSNDRIIQQALSHGLAHAGRILADQVTERLLLPWLFRAKTHGRLAEAVDDIGPLTDDLPCDAALAALDRRHQRVLVCGVFCQNRRLGEDRVRVFARAGRRLLQTAWPGWSGRILITSLSGFTERTVLRNMIFSFRTKRSSVPASTRSTC